LEKCPSNWTEKPLSLDKYFRFCHTSSYFFRLDPEKVQLLQQNGEEQTGDGFLGTSCMI
jgi:hypothetical protein